MPFSSNPCKNVWNSWNIEKRSFKQRPLVEKSMEPSEHCETFLHTITLWKKVWYLWNIIPSARLECERKKRNRKNLVKKACVEWGWNSSWKSVIDVHGFGHLGSASDRCCGNSFCKFVIDVVVQHDTGVDQRPPPQPPPKHAPPQPAPPPQLAPPLRPDEHAPPPHAPAPPQSAADLEPVSYTSSIHCCEFKVHQSWLSIPEGQVSGRLAWADSTITAPETWPVVNILVRLESRIIKSSIEMKANRVSCVDRHCKKTYPSRLCSGTSSFSSPSLVSYSWCQANRGRRGRWLLIRAPQAPHSPRGSPVQT